MDAALDLIPKMAGERQALQDKAERFRQALRQMGLSTLDSTTQIIPILLGESQRAVDCAQFLAAKGLLAMAIRPPTVEEGKARLRIALNLLHGEVEIAQLLAALQEFLDV